MPPEVRRSPLALAVLALLVYRPLHPYGLQALMKQWGKDQVINVSQRASLYKTIRRLLAAGLIAVRHTEREQQYPERTVYELTDQGRAATTAWLEEMLAAPRAEYPEFPAALSFLMLVAPARALELLEQRKSLLAARVAELDATLAAYADSLPRVSLVETDYVRAVTAAELHWVTEIAADLQAGRLTWSKETLRAYHATHPPSGLELPDQPGPCGPDAPKQ
jgi:DNA-binding PadR family transcriptional regulator